MNHYTLVEDTRAAAEQRGWKYTEHLPAAIQMRYGSRTTQAEAVLALKHATVWDSLNFHYSERDFPEPVTQYLGKLASVHNYPMPAVFACELPDARLIGAHGMIVSAQGDVLLDSRWVTFRNRARFDLIRYAPLPDASPHLRHALPLLPDHSHVYGHWLTDCLPRLASVDLADPDLTIILPRAPIPAHFESLEMLGLSPTQMLPQPSAHNLRADRVTLLNLPKIWLRPRQEQVHWLRARLNVPPATAARRLFVSRGNLRRRLLNEDEIERLLRGYGFQTIYPHEMTFAEHMRVFGEAQIILGMYGSGMFNAMLAPPGTLVITPQNPYWWDPELMRLTSLLSQHHWYMFGESVGPDYETWVDPARLEDLLVTALRFHNL